MEEINKPIEKKKKSLLLETLIREQEKNKEHYLNEVSLQSVAKTFGMSKEQVREIASFYTGFSFSPRGKYVIKVCNSPYCHFQQEKTIINALESILGIKIGETTKDRLFTLEKTGCLGACHQGPALMINDRIFDRITENKICNIIELYQRENRR